MIRSLKRFFADDSNDTSVNRPVSLAVAALLVEVMRIDDRLEKAEQSAVFNALEKRYGLNRDELNALIKQAKQETADAHDLHQFTSQVKEHYSVEERIEIVTELWQVAMADGHIDKHEEHVIRRVADLLGVYHNEFIRAKIAARSS